jgi:hypothetical protein
MARENLVVHRESLGKATEARDALRKTDPCE